MTVYVDNPKTNYRRMKMCHMIADNDAELIAMVDKIGVARKWHQFPETRKSHFDICLAKRKLAVQYGAIEVSSKEIVRIIQRRT